MGGGRQIFSSLSFAYLVHKNKEALFLVIELLEGHVQLCPPPMLLGLKKYSYYSPLSWHKSNIYMENIVQVVQMYVIYIKTFLCSSI